MSFWPIAVLVFGGAFVAGLVMPRGAANKRPAPFAPDEEEHWTPDALARLHA